MKTNYLKLLAIFFLVILSVIKLKAHGDEDHPDVEIHVFENGETWTNCSFMIHSSLTQSEFLRFTKEAGSIIYFQPLSGASSLGRYNFDISLSANFTPIDQTSGAWNNTFAHPVTDPATEDPHYLGDKVTVPNLRIKMGLTKNIEVGAYITKDFNANYGFFGAEIKYTHTADIAGNINIAARASYAQLFGSGDLELNVSSLDALLSKTWWKFEPYLGVSASLNHAKETTGKVSLDNVNSLTPHLLLGTKFKYNWASASIEYDISTLNTIAFKIGVSF